MSMTSALLAPAVLAAGSLAAETGGEPHVVWHLPIPALAYGVISLVAFFALLGITWMFRNAGHTLMAGSDTVEHGHGKHRAPSHGASAGGHGPGH